MRRRLFFFLSLFSLFLFGFSTGRAASPAVETGSVRFESSCPAPSKNQYGMKDVCAEGKVVPGSNVTWFDLLKQIYPDLKPDGKASDLHKIREEIKETEIFSGFPGPSPGNFTDVGPYTYLLVSEAGRTRALLLQTDNGLLAYLQVTPALKLLDLIDTAKDQHVDFAGQPVLTVAPGQFVFSLNSWHFNSSESYNIYNLFLAGPEQLRFVYDGPMLMGYRSPKNEDCFIRQELTPLSMLPTQKDGISDLSMKVMQTKECDTKGGKTKVIPQKTFESVLSWDKAKRKYMGGSKELFRLNQCLLGQEKGCPPNP